jgi:uncharacterized glyoxalase superfamily protein PhnB
VGGHILLPAPSRTGPTAVQEPQLKSATDDLRGRVRDTFGTAWWLAAQ